MIAKRTKYTDAYHMSLPEGKTCADCMHCERCARLLGQSFSPQNEVCDWAPSRFVDAFAPRAMICTRKGDPSWQPIPGSQELPCSHCSSLVMISPATCERLRPIDIVLCVECAAELARTRGQKWIDAGRNERQLSEMAAAGIEPKQFGEK